MFVVTSQKQEQAWGQWYLLEYRAHIGDKVSKGGDNKMHKVRKAEIKYMHPLFWDKVIYSKNGKYYNGKKLIIKIIRKTNKMTVYSTHTKHGGSLPTSFFKKIFGINNSLLRISSDGNEYDVFNCYMQYNDQFGTFSYGFDLGWRIKHSSMPWQTCYGPQKELPE